MSGHKWLKKRYIDTGHTSSKWLKDKTAWSRPALHVNCHKMTLVVNWRYLNKIDLTFKRPTLHWMLITMFQMIMTIQSNVNNLQMVMKLWQINSQSNSVQRVNLAKGLNKNLFALIVVIKKPQWLDRETTLYKVKACLALVYTKSHSNECWIACF